MGEYNVSPHAYGQMTHLLSSLANGKIILTLEVSGLFLLTYYLVTQIFFCTLKKGGYNLRTIADCSLECIKVLLGDPPVALSLDETELNDCAIETLQNVIDYQSSNWPSLALNIDIPDTKL